MSQTSLLPIECPECYFKGEMEFKIINIDQTPELKKDIFNNEIFMWTCPVCGAKVFAYDYGLLYHDMKNQCIISIALFDDNPLAKLIMPEIPDSLLNLSGYKYRTVSSIGQLKEKIFILDAGLDDVVIEYMKYCFKHIKHAKNFYDGDRPAFVLTDADDEDKTECLRFFIIDPEDKIQGLFSVPKAEYEAYALKVHTDPRLQAQPFTNVCEKWIDSKLRQIC